MTIRKRWLLALPIVLAVFVATVFVAGRSLRARLEPMVRDQATRYLEHRFQGEVQLAGLRIHLPRLSTFGLVFHRQSAAIVEVDAEGLSIRRDGIQLFLFDKMHFSVSVGSILELRKKVDYVSLHGVQITVPPKGEARSKTEDGKKDAALNLEIGQVDIRDATLTILPKDKSRNPLSYKIEHVLLTPIGPNAPMNYAADLNIPKPPGHILSRGHFGPWNENEPGDTSLDGTYQFEHADLSVFKGIAGILHSTGEFKGVLDAIHCSGEADVPDFRLTMAGNPIPLRTHFDAMVDGTNGNTILQPVQAILGQTHFTTSGAIVKHQNAAMRVISLQVNMPDGNLPDLLRLSMKGSPFMEGRITMNSRIDIPPLTGKVEKKLLLDGRFTLRTVRFLRSTIQSQIDGLSRHAQGEPKNQEIDSVASNMKGTFRLENQVMTFRSLSFNVPGAGVAVAGTYNLGSQNLNFQGTLMLEAKVSQMVTGWKSLVLKPIDPLFAKNGAGTFLNIVVEGSAQHPKFGAEFANHKFMVKRP